MRPEDPSFEIVETYDPALLERIRLLRSEVWRLHSPAFPEELRERRVDEGDANAVHFAALWHGDLVGAARLSVVSQIAAIPDRHVFPSELNVQAPIASINRLVVASRAQGLGIARRLDEARLAVAKARGCRSVVVSVSQWSGWSRVHALEALGFEKLRPGFDIPFGDWRGMMLPIARVAPS